MKKTVQPVSPSLVASCSLFLALLRSILFFFGIPVTLLRHFWNWNKCIYALFACCCCYRHKTSLSRAVRAVIETYHLCFLHSSHRWCHIFRAIDEKHGSFHAGIFFLFFFWLKLISFVYWFYCFTPARRSEPMANIEGRWWNTRTHTVGRRGVWTAWGLASCRVTEQVKEFFF